MPRELGRAVRMDLVECAPRPPRSTARHLDLPIIVRRPLPLTDDLSPSQSIATITKKLKSTLCAEKLTSAKTVATVTDLLEPLPDIIEANAEEAWHSGMIEALVQSVPAIIEFGKKHSMFDPDSDMLAAVLDSLFRAYKAIGKSNASEENEGATQGDDDSDRTQLSLLAVEASSSHVLSTVVTIVIGDCDTEIRELAARLLAGAHA